MGGLFGGKQKQAPAPKPQPLPSVDNSAEIEKKKNDAVKAADDAEQRRRRAALASNLIFGADEQASIDAQRKKEKLGG